jgi:photosystem II stability/assembly factor-like uncharacterized protein
MFKIRASAVVILILLTCIACNSGQIRSFQPNIPNGGRTVALTVNPRTEQHIIAATETGGLFKSTSGGRLWYHLDGLPLFALNDVKYSPSNSSIVLATAWIDTRVDNGGGIWRSTNGGVTWSQPPSAAPSASDRCNERISAYGIAFEPGSGRVFVGTDCGLAISEDLGATWRHVVLDETVTPDRDRVQNKVLSVLALDGGKIHVAGLDGVWNSDDSGRIWTKSTTPLRIMGKGVFGVHKLAASPDNSDHLFFANDDTERKLYSSVDGGSTWTVIRRSDEFNRVALVKTAQSVSDPSEDQPQGFDVYFGDGVTLFRRSFESTSSGITPVDEWRALISDHADPADMAFDLSGRDPILLATDGGVHSTADRGDSWTLIGGGAAGFHALQITEVTGHQVLDGEDFSHLKTQLYFGTQDNDLWASDNGGRGWANPIPSEGFDLEVRRIGFEPREGMVTGSACFECWRFLADPVFRLRRPWRDPPDPASSPILLAPNIYIQSSLVRVPTRTLQITGDLGSTWDEVVDVPYEIRGFQVAGPLYNPVLYVAIRRPGTTPTGARKVGLLKISGILGYGPLAVTEADRGGLGSLGMFPTAYAWYVVLGVDPGNPDHIIAPDIVDRTIKVSRDGGQTWEVDEELTDKVTNSGEFLLFDHPYNTPPSYPPAIQVHAISFEPTNPDHILVGTQQAGIIRSTDGGASWTRVGLTERITNISSFYFDHDGSVIVSTYGRGLWKLVFEDQATQTPETDAVVQAIETPDTAEFQPGAGPIVVEREAGPYISVSGDFFVHGLPKVFDGESITVYGSGFEPYETSNRYVTLFVGQDLVSQDIQADESGAFIETIVLKNKWPGYYNITARQEIDQGALEDTSDILVSNRDEE